MDMNLEELDLSVFENDFDPHKRGKQSIRVINNIKANHHPNFKTKLCKYNQEKLLEYAAWMIRKIKRQELCVCTFEKNLSSAWVLAICFDQTPANKVTQAQLKEWWEQELKRYEGKEVRHGTIQKKFKNCQHFFKWLYGLNGHQKLDLMDLIEMPKAPKPELCSRMPTQEEVKELISAAYTSDKFSLRNQAIMALANDTGARISEILSMRNKHVRPEKNYLVVSFPESKTVPRTVISYLAKPYLENWAKLSPNKQAGPDAFFFCQSNGKPITYAAIKKSFDTARAKTGIPWKERRALHFFRNIFTSRSYNWPYAVKHHWLGWSFKDQENVYTQISYKQCIEQYFDMLKKENNPMLGEDQPFWNEQKADDKIIERLKEMPEFDLLLRKLVRQG